MFLGMAMGDAVAAEIPVVTIPSPVPPRATRLRKSAQGVFLGGAGLVVAGSLSFPVTAYTTTGWHRYVGLTAIPLGIPLMTLGAYEDRRAVRLAGGDVTRFWADLSLGLWGGGMALGGLGAGGFALAPDTQEGRHYTLSAVMLTLSTLSPMLLIASAVSAGAQVDLDERFWQRRDGEAAAMRPVVTARVEPQLWTDGGGLVVSGTW